MKKSNKFTQDFSTLYESYFSRYTAGCFGIGDVVTFDKKIFNDPQFKALAPDMQAKAKEMIEASLAGDAIIAISQVDLDGHTVNQYQTATITIAYSQGGGMYYGRVTIPGSLGQYMTRVGDVYSKLPPHAIKKHSSERQAVDTNKVQKAFMQGYIPDVRQTKKQLS